MKDSYEDNLSVFVKFYILIKKKFTLVILCDD